MMKVSQNKYYYSALVAITMWLGSVPIEAWAGRTARRAAEACKSEACDGGGGDGVPWILWVMGFIVCLGLFLAFLDWVASLWKRCVQYLKGSESG